MTAKCKVLQSHCKVVLEGSAVFTHGTQNYCFTEWSFVGDFVTPCLLTLKGNHWAKRLRLKQNMTMWQTEPTSSSSCIWGRKSLVNLLRALMMFVPMLVASRGQWHLSVRVHPSSTSSSISLSLLSEWTSDTATISICGTKGAKYTPQWE